MKEVSVWMRAGGGRGKGERGGYHVESTSRGA
jgi:hypothetical protein